MSDTNTNIGTEDTEDIFVDDSLSKLSPLMQKFKDVKAVLELKIGGPGDTAAQYFFADADEMVEIHPNYANAVNVSHNFYMNLPPEQREGLILTAKELLGDIYENVENWLPYSLIMRSTETEFAGVGFYFNIIFVDLKDIVDANRKKSQLEINDAERKLAQMLGELEGELDAETLQEIGASECLVVTLNPEDSEEIVLKAAALGVDPGEYVANALQSYNQVNNQCEQPGDEQPGT